MSRPTIEESAWLDTLPVFPDQPVGRVVAVTARPGDHTIVSGLLQQLRDRGADIDLVIATDGEPACPDRPVPGRVTVDRCRRDELRDALAAQGLADVTVHWLGLPDSDLVTHRTTLAERLVDLLRDAEVCLAPWPEDPDADHRILGEVVLRVAPITTYRWSYPTGEWHPASPDDRVDDASAHVYRLDGPQRQRKAAGIAAFAAPPGPGPDLDAEVLFRHPRRDGAPLRRFVELYDSAEDPWQVATSWYERRKQDVALASLPRQRYGTIVEPGCGVGGLTTALAARCDRLIAFDPVAAAVRRCRTRTGSLSNVTVEIGMLPAGMPAGPVDLVVFSEILYYLSDADLKTTVDEAVAALRPEGQILAVHWLPWAADAPRDGMAAHRKLLAHPCVERLVEHVDERFVLHVLGRR